MKDESIILSMDAIADYSRLDKFENAEAVRLAAQASVDFLEQHKWSRLFFEFIIDEDRTV